MSDPNVVVARNTDKAPVSDLYSQTVAFSHYNNLSAQLPIDPATGAIVAGGAAEQAEQCFKNLQAIVESIGHDMNDIIRVSIFLADIMDLNAVEKVQASFFPTYQPARTVVAVDALPQGALVFIEALVDNGEGTQSVPQAGDLVKLTNNTHAAPYDAPPRPWRSPTTTTSPCSCRSIPARAAPSWATWPPRPRSACAT